MQSDFFLSILPILFIFLIFYFLLIRPQTKAEQKRKELIKNLKKGEVVWTSGGILGKVIDIAQKFVILEVAKDVKIRILRDTIQGIWKEEEIKGKDKEKK